MDGDKGLLEDLLWVFNVISRKGRLYGPLETKVFRGGGLDVDGVIEFVKFRSWMWLYAKQQSLRI